MLATSDYQLQPLTLVCPATFQSLLIAPGGENPCVSHVHSRYFRDFDPAASPSSLTFQIFIDAPDTGGFTTFPDVLVIFL